MTTKTLPPRCGLRGWDSAWAVLERTRSSQRRDVLAFLARQGGVAGPGLKYLAQMLRFRAGDGDYPTPPKGLGAFEIELIHRRALELLEPFEGDDRLPRMRARR